MIYALVALLIGVAPVGQMSGHELHAQQRAAVVVHVKPGTFVCGLWTRTDLRAPFSRNCLSTPIASGRP